MIDEPILTIDLDGPHGNAHYLMSMAGLLCYLQGKDKLPILDDMKRGDYDHLVNVFTREFGNIVILHRANGGQA